MAKSIKDQNRWQLWLAIVANVVAFYLLMQWDTVTANGMTALVTKAAHILPLGLALVVVTVINGLLSPDAKARIVFLRWKHALPGHRAFSELAPRDPRIDMERLKKACGNRLPASPEEQNKVWYGLYKPIEKHNAIEHVQRDFLLTRDYACFVSLAAVVFGIAAFVEIGSTKIAALYVAAMIAQFVVARQAAANYGRRFVTTVMAEKAVSTPAPRARPKAVERADQG